MRLLNTQVYPKKRLNLFPKNNLYYLFTYFVNKRYNVSIIVDKMEMGCMKIMVASDVHGSIKHLKILYKNYLDEKPSQMIFLGDMFDNMLGVDDTLLEILKGFSPCIFIRGNCDKEMNYLDFVSDYSLEAFGKKIFCSHGHIYDRHLFPDEDFDVMIGGHTHIGMIFLEGDKYFLNPGSVSLPKGFSKNSYMILDDEGIYLKDLEQKIIEYKNWK